MFEGFELAIIDTGAALGGAAPGPGFHGRRRRPAPITRRRL